MLAFFEFIPSKSIIDWIKGKFGVKTVEGEYDVFTDGPIVIGGVLNILIMILLLLLKKCESIVAINQKVYKIYKKIDQNMFYNFIIRYFFSGAIKL